MDTALMGNIGSAEQRKRAVFGSVGLVIAIALLVGLHLSDVSALWRLLTLPFFFVATIGFLQAREKT